MGSSWTRAELEAIAVDNATRAGIDPLWIRAIVTVESAWRWDAINDAGPDGARGGSYGLGQISLQSAREWGFTGTVQDLMEPHNNLEVMCQHLGELQPESIEDAASLWNDNRRWSDPDLAHSTRERYVPRVLMVYQRELLP